MMCDREEPGGKARTTRLVARRFTRDGEPRLLQRVLRDGTTAQVAQQIPEHFELMTPVELLEGARLTGGEAAEQLLVACRYRSVHERQYVMRPVRRPRDRLHKNAPHA